MGRRPLHTRRTPSQAATDRRAGDLSGRVGRGLREARQSLRLRQCDVAERAGIARSTWSAIERGVDARVTLETLCRCAMAVDSDLHAYLERLPGAERPKDHVHLRHQELVIATARRGGWDAMPESLLASTTGRTSWVDVLLRRHISAVEEWVLIEIWDWFDDVGGAFRSWDRRLREVENMTGRPCSGVWVIRATKRNRQLVREHANVFRTRFPGSGSDWLAALTNPDRPAPAQAALLWVSVDGSRLSATRL